MKVQLAVLEDKYLNWIPGFGRGLKSGLKFGFLRRDRDLIQRIKCLWHAESGFDPVEYSPWKRRGDVLLR